MGDSKFAVVDVGKLSKPITKLIESVSGAVGAVYEPRRIRRKAKAEADAMIIFADAEIEVAKRAARRLGVQEVRRQQNIETIVDSAAKLLPETVSEEPVDPDWMSRFFADAADVSEEHLQKIWAKLLAQEVAEPGRCSRRMLSILKEMNWEDARRFERLCGLVWYRENHGFVPLDEELVPSGGWESQVEYLSRFDIVVDDLLELDSLGLIHYQEDLAQSLSTGSIISNGQSFYVLYVHQKSGANLSLEAFPLTRSGYELSLIVGSEPNKQFHENTLKLLVRLGAKIACPLPERQKGVAQADGV
ncbi:MAG: DUF2806 domain-containing protein [Phycisphaerales bacterium]